ncbi:hypothetical protein SAMN06295905_0212 [Devosia lucknowensis]|uniref:Uncharacterized protein n=1 Tax=Devosia lucknowensis TaxID=1096929 RepID=A0A1Y6E9Y9_9HYPH|nr:hypothetical protein [Devosia lucknowensis]SMQ59319.1 hypothetical protein SAMN06295905_0212 [Devosia lucknowensis]
MSARLLRVLLASPLLFTPVALAKEKPPREAIACEGAFAIDSSEARLIEIYGADNVWTGTVPGPEGMDMQATRVFPDDPDRMLEFTWWNEDERTDLGSVELPPTMSGPGGIHDGMSVAEVAAINGDAFTLNGFGWDYGGFASFRTGVLSDIEGGCYLSLRFGPDDRPVKVNTDAVWGDREVPSTEPLLETVGAHVQVVSIGYPHPDFRD